MKKHFVNLTNIDNSNSRNKKYSKVIDSIKKDNVCPFCPDYLLKYHKKPIIEENKNWISTKNMYPYEGSKIQILFIHKKHISSMEEITTIGWLDLKKIIDSTTKRLKIKKGSFFMRFGNTKYTGASVTHLHCHILVSKKNKSPLLVKLG